jgi:hypothetical protein
VETTPDAEPIVATPVADQVPPVVLLLSVPDNPAQMLNVPKMALGNGLTVMVVFTLHPVGNT